MDRISEQEKEAVIQDIMNTEGVDRDEAVERYKLMLAEMAEMAIVRGEIQPDELANRDEQAREAA